MTRSVTGTRRQPRVAARSGTCGRRPSDRIRTDPAAPGCGSGSPSGLHGCRIHPSRRPGCLTAGSGPGGEPREAGMQTRAAVGSGRLQSGGGRRPGVLERLAGWRYGLGGFALACLAAMRRIAAGRRHWPATLMIIWTVAPVVEVIWLSRRCRGAHRPCPAGCGRADAQEPGRVPAGQPDRRGMRGCAAAGFGVHGVGMVLPRRRPLPAADQAPARSRRSHQRIRAGRVEAQVKNGGRVLEPTGC
jgi:hypothetical protein